jgi:Fe-S cluster assembly protein SufD
MITHDKQDVPSFLAGMLLEWNRGKTPGSWIHSWREEGLEKLQKISFPTRAEEDWKKFPLKMLFEKKFYRTEDNFLCEHKSFEKFSSHFEVELVFVNGVFCRELSRGIGEENGIFIYPLSQVLPSKEKEMRFFLDCFQGQAEDAFVLMNQAFSKEGAVILISDKRRCEKIIHVVHGSTQTKMPCLHSPRTVIALGKNAEATVVESFVSFSGDAYFTNAVSDLILDAGASLHYFKIQSESSQAFQIAATRALLGRDSQLHSFSFSVGGKIARNNLFVSLNEEGASVSLDGLYAGKGDQFLDNHTSVDHRKPHGISRQLYKGVLTDRARAVFNGKIVVHAGAQQTDSSQLNKNLLLSRQAHVDTKPELQISANDVQCKHGATIGQLNEDEIFYFQSRSIPRKKAVHMLIHGFVDDVLTRIQSSQIRKKLQGLLLDFYSGVEGEDCL